MKSIKEKGKEKETEWKNRKQIDLENKLVIKYIWIMHSSMSVNFISRPTTGARVCVCVFKTHLL